MTTLMVDGDVKTDIVKSMIILYDPETGSIEVKSNDNLKVEDYQRFLKYVLQELETHGKGAKKDSKKMHLF